MRVDEIGTRRTAAIYETVQFAEMKLELIVRSLEINEVKMNRGKLVVAGDASSTAGTPPGQVLVELDGDQSKTKTSALHSGRFKVKKRICDPGRWRATAKYGGALDFAAAVSTPAVVRVRERQTRC